MSPVARSSQALVVGISQYRYIGKLRKTKDASGMRDVLASPAYCAYPPERVRLLEDDEATRGNILEALKAMCQGAGEAASRTFFYFTGHGGQGPDGASYILPVDARRGEYPGTAISARDLSQVLDQCRGEFTVVLDCCRAASMSRPDVGLDSAVPGDPDPQDIGLERFTDSLGRAIRSREVIENHATRRVLFAASRATGRAFTAPEAPYSLFTGHMLDCLRGADAESSGGANVTIGQLFAYLEKHVGRDSDGSQRPLLISETESLYTLTDYPRAMRHSASFEKDVFISYHRDDVELEDWVSRFFQPELEHAGISILEHDDIGAGKLEVSKAIVKCRYFIVILTQSYLKYRFEEFAAATSIIESIETRTRRFIVILREQVVLPPEYNYFASLDMTPRREMRFRKDMDRLIKRLKKQPGEQ